MSKSTLNISCIIAAHHEGIMLHWSLLSYEAMRVYAEERGAHVEWVLVLDRANEETVRVALNHPGLRKTDTVIHADNGSLSMTRNNGVVAAKGDIICILDADDYYTKNFLWEGAKEAAANNGCIVHPHFMLSFGAVTCIHELWDMRSHPEIDASALVFQHPWSSAVIAKKEIFTRVPYLAFGKGLGFEDWQWNCETIAHGYTHIIAKQTVRFYRRRNDGMLAGMAGYVMPPTSLFNLGFLKMNQEESITEATPGREYRQKWLKRTFKRWGHSIYKRLPVYGKRTLSRWSRSIQKRLPARPVANAVLPNNALPFDNFFKDALFEISHIDPKLHPSYFPDKLPEWIPDLHKDWGKIFLEVCAAYGKKHYDVVYIVPWIIPGGADLMIINHANACARHGKKVLVISTLDLKASTWASRLDEQVEFLELGFIIARMPCDIQITFLTKLLLQMAPGNIHIINSSLAHECVKWHGAALSQYTSIISTYYCDEIHHDGRLFGYSVDYLTDEYPYVKKYTSDNSIFPKEWCHRYGTDYNKFHITYGIIEKHDFCYSLSGTSNKVFWASRICDQKRPDILYHVASRMPHVEFHVYGGKYDNEFADEVTKLKQLPNVVMKGEYAGFQSIPFSDYAAFLYTSKTDGLPNVLLEAGEAGLPIVGSVVGGISEFLTKETGWPIPSNDPADFIAALEEVLANPELAVARGRKARELVHERHSEEAFWNNLNELYEWKEKKEYDEIMSLGSNCEVSFRIKDAFGAVPSYLFSWIYVADIKRLLDALKFPDKVASDELTYSHAGMFVCSNTGFSIHSKFSEKDLHDEEGRLIEAKNAEAITEIRSRIGHLAQKTKDIINSDSKVLCVLKVKIHNSDEVSDTIAAIIEIHEFLHDKNNTLLCVVEAHCFDQFAHLKDKGILVEQVAYFADDASTDRGGDLKGWVNILSNFRTCN